MDTTEFILAVIGAAATFLAGSILGFKAGYTLGWNDAERGIYLGVPPNARPVNPRDSN